jgi:hypothetical protein
MVIVPSIIAAERNISRKASVYFSFIILFNTHAEAVEIRSLPSLYWEIHEEYQFPYRC